MAWTEAARAAALEARRRQGMSKHGGQVWKLAHGGGPAWLKAGRGGDSAARLRALKLVRSEQATKKKLGFHPAPKSSIGSSSSQKSTVSVHELRQHPNYSSADFKHLTDKGYTPKEIKSLWDRDRTAGHGPQGYQNKPKHGLVTGQHLRRWKRAHGG